MRICLKFVFLFLSFTISCAQKTNQEKEDHTIIYQSMSSGKDRYLTCNMFADDTFRGYVWSDSKTPDYKRDCVYIDITKNPKEFLKNEDLFLQIYPFSIVNNEISYGSSLPIKTIKKFIKDEEKKVLVLSHIIDTYLVETELDLEPDHFFLDHLLEVCDIEEKQGGLQLVIYERRESQEDPAPIRITQFLLPPFLVHPEHFRDANGSALAAFHPFLKYISELKSKPSSYYDLAEKMCRLTL